jgi:hypothetical protein
MRGIPSFLRLTLRSRMRRLAGLAAFGLLFLAAGATARIFTGGEHGHIEMDQIFALGGTTLVSALLLLGWLVGRFPLIAAVVLMAGIFSDDRARGHARIYAVLPPSPVLLYGARFVLLACVAFLMSAVLLPLFDVVVLGELPHATVFALIGGQIIVFGTLTALLSTLMRADAWAALFVGMAGIVWDGLRRVELVAALPPALRQTVSVMLPPQGALARIETAFASLQPVPWDAVLYVSLYGALLLVIAGAILARREI